MIDIESTVFDYVASALRDAYDTVYVKSVPSDTPTKFPAVCLWEQSNIAFSDTQTAENRENHSKLLYQCEIYSNLANNGKKQQAKAIANLVDEKMQEIGFTRTFGQPIPNVADMTIFRYTMRFEGIIGKDNVLYTT